METKRFRVRAGCTLSHNGTILRGGADVDLTELQYKDAAVMGFIVPVDPPTPAAATPAPTPAPVAPPVATKEAQS